MRQILLAIQFLTIIPIKLNGEVRDKDMAGSSSFFPVAGALQGLLVSMSAAIFIRVFPPEITSAIMVLVLIISNGGFDIDGLADTFDALAVKSSGDAIADREKRLSVMKDSMTGSIGTTAIVIILLLKVFLMNNLFTLLPLQIPLYLLLFLMPVFSKWATVPAMYHGISARKDGLGRIFIENVRLGNVALSTLLMFLLYLLAAMAMSYNAFDPNGLILFAVLSIILYLFSLLSARISVSKFGGMTGDSFGAITEITEILYLMVTSTWLQHSI